MQPTQTLPPGYHPIRTLDLTKDRGMLLALNLAGVIIMILTGWLFFIAMVSIRTQELAGGFNSIEANSLLDTILLLGIVLLLTSLYVILHEAIHGAFFWWFTRDRPVFAFHLTHAYAAAPAWFIPRNSYLITGLAPLVIISLMGLLLFWVVPASWLLGIWFILTMNAAGAVGDMLVAILLLRQPPTCLAQDKGSSITLFNER